MDSPVTSDSSSDDRLQDDASTGTFSPGGPQFVADFRLSI